MPIKVAVLKETATHEKRIALVPEVAQRLQRLDVEVHLETGFGATLGFADDLFKDCIFHATTTEVLANADIILTVQPPTVVQIQNYPQKSILLGFLAPYNSSERIKALQDQQITAFSMELVPRISRAQSIDALSSQASAAGYKAVLLGANLCPKFFPMLTTAAGTIRPARVLIIGAGVAGLQAIATAKRLGAIVEAYDVRSETREQTESLGAKFIDTGVSAAGEGGYARQLTDAEKQQQQDVLATHIAKADVVITTAAIPGKPAPKIITEQMVAAMKPCSVIIDLAAESGGNCQLTQPDQTIEHHGVVIHGPVNLASQLATHTSEMYAKNLLNFLVLLIKEGEITLEWEDEIIAGSAVTHNGKIIHEGVKNLLEPNQQETATTE